MTFDEEFKADAERMFERVSKLERSTDDGKTWAPLEWGQITEAAYKDKSRACELASPAGVRMTDGSAVRFVVPRLKTPNAEVSGLSARPPGYRAGTNTGEK